jgi:hypothetical protein
MKYAIWLVLAGILTAGAGCTGKESPGEVPKEKMTPPKEGPQFMGMKPGSKKS